MKQINLLSALLLLCLYACNNKPYPHTMQVADKLVYSNPDSACLLLEQLRDSITTEPKATQKLNCRNNIGTLLYFVEKDERFTLDVDILPTTEHKGQRQSLYYTYL